MASEPPIKFDAVSLAKGRARFWVRLDNVAVNLLLPFNQKTQQFTAIHNRDPTPTELYDFMLHARDTYAWVTLQMATQVTIACAFVSTQSSVLRSIAYQYDVAARLKGHHLKNFLETLYLPRFICRLATQGAAPPTEEDLAYEEECNPAVAVLQRIAIPHTVSYCYFVASLLMEKESKPSPNEKRPSRTERSVLKLVALVGDAATQALAFFVTSSNGQSPRTCHICAEVSSALYSRFALPRIQRFLAGHFKTLDSLSA
eukprot:TRINITY_DN6757_c0_g1_i1.p2 TRINITY_DN6757_c0_g1~~TRINITY_DN6757_c0_g1_i1.p2  ORF type:complete len:258 (+),score=66.69 TRINITY_DN6757_c0_g1_i1:55-828(+)